MMIALVIIVGIVVGFIALTMDPDWLPFLFFGMVIALAGGFGVWVILELLDILRAAAEKS